MKKIFLLLILIFGLSYLGWGQVALPHLDPLNYTVGENLAAQTDWTSMNSGDDLLIAPGNLSYSDLPASSGNMVSFDGSGIDAAKQFTQQISGTTYHSFLLNVANLGSLNTTGGYFEGFSEGTSNTFGATVWLRKDAGGVGYNIGINPRTTAGNTSWVSGVQSVNTTLFVVFSYQIVAGVSNDVVKIWINPTPGGSEPSASATATNALTDLTNVNRILVRQDGATATPFIEMDELRIATTWAGVAPSGSSSPTVTTQAVSGIGVTGATGNGTIAATGGPNATARGVCWDVYANPDPDLLDIHSTESGDFGIGSFSGAITPISAETHYKAVAYATNPTGTGYGSAVNFWSFSTEPSSHTSTFTYTVISQTQIDLNFDAASTITNADGYIILQKTGSEPTGTPTDGTAYPVGNVIGDGTVAAIVTNTSATSTSINGLSAGTHYYFKIMPYNWNSANSETYNYKTDETIPGTDGTTEEPLSATSEISGPAIGSQPNPGTISSLVTTSGAAVRVFDMDGYDYGGDGEPTKITQVTIKSGTNNTANWLNSIQGVRLSIDGGTSFVTIGTPAILASSIVIPITLGNLDIPDGAAITISLYIFLNISGLTDNSIFEFKVDAAATSHGFVADETGSTFTPIFSSAPVSNQMTLSVTATKLDFVQQPTNVGTGANISPAVTVSADDANGNKDLDYSTNISITASGATLNGSPVSIAPSSGLSTFGTLSFSTDGTGVTLNATSGSLTGVSSNSFNVILVPSVSEILINQFNPAYSGASNEYIELVNKTNKTFDLSQLKIMYSSASGSTPGSLGTLSGTLDPYGFWLISPDATVNIGQSSGIARDGSFNAGMAGASGQFALETLSNSIIDGVAYGTITSNILGKGDPTASPSSNSGFKRTSDGVNSNDNLADFSSVSTTDIYLRNHNSYCFSETYALPSLSYSGDVVISGSSPGITLSGTTVISGKLNILAGSLTVANGQALTVSGDLTNSAGNSGLVIQSNVSGTGSLITNGAVSGNITAERYIPGYSKGTTGFHLLSSPVQSQLISTEFVDVAANPIPSTLDFYSFSEELNRWINIKKGDGTYNQGETGENFSNDDNPAFITGKGYLVAYSSDQDKSFAGVPNTGDIASGSGIPALTFTSGFGDGWNLIGNPYPSAIDWDLGSWSLVNLNGSVYVLDGTSGNYISWNGTAGDLTDGIVPAMQGFFVKAEASGASLTIPNASRIAGSLNPHKSVNKSADNVLVLEAESGGQSDRLYLQFSPQATLNYDSRSDAYKLFGTGGSPQVYSSSTDGVILSINVLPELNEGMAIPVNLKVISDGLHKITLKENTLLTAVPVILEDKKENKSIDLSITGYYLFESFTSDRPDRFVLHFSGVGIDENKVHNFISIYSTGNQLFLSDASGKSLEGEVFVYNLLGQQILQQKLAGGTLSTINLNVHTGYYIVKVVTERQTLINKVFIH